MRPIPTHAERRFSEHGNRSEFGPRMESGTRVAEYSHRPKALPVMSLDLVLEIARKNFRSV